MSQDLQFEALGRARALATALRDFTDQRIEGPFCYLGDDTWTAASLAEMLLEQVEAAVRGHRPGREGGAPAPMGA